MAFHYIESNGEVVKKVHASLKPGGAFIFQLSIL
ncbi:hypothetical protein [Brevibacillus laterosporus]